MMKPLLFPSAPPWRQIALWVAIGLLLASVMQGYWLISCIVLVGVIALLIVLQSQS